MAQKAKKDRAKANAAALYNLHAGSALVNGLFLVFWYLFKSRSLLLYLVLSLPGLLCQIFLEQTGRPAYDGSGALKSAGEDLAAQGLTEYMFDVVWVTWSTVVLVILFGNKLWLLWAIVPAYGAYKGFNLFTAAQRMATPQDADQAAAPVTGNRRQRRAA